MIFAAFISFVVLASEGPCDILDAAGNPCVAAHSTTRALYAKYDGPLYNVTKPNGAVSGKKKRERKEKKICKSDRST